jgi:hypothetical protein
MVSTRTEFPRMTACIGFEDQFRVGKLPRETALVVRNDPYVHHVAFACRHWVLQRNGEDQGPTALG